MLKIFRRARQKLIHENKISSYLLYAIGEIALVMIGILLALQVNNWNEERKIKNELNSILKTVSLDLERDTLVSGAIVTYYEGVEKSSQKIINKEINRNNYKECPECRSLVSVYRPFTIQTKGYDLLKKYSDQNSIKNDTLITNISQFYSPFIQIIDDSNEFVKTEVFKNIETFKTKPWFVEWTQANYNQEMIIFFTESEEYRKMVASHNLLAAKNHLLFISAYKRNAEVLIKKINDRLQHIK